MQHVHTEGPHVSQRYDLRETASFQLSLGIPPFARGYLIDLIWSTLDVEVTAAWKESL